MRGFDSNYYLLLIICILFTACGNKQQTASPPSITIAVAANMQFAIEELTGAFTEVSGIHCEKTISSSGKLTAQIRQGAPFDVFVAADMKYPDEIYRNGLAVDSPKVYAYGKVVLWTMQEDIPLSLNELSSNAIQHIALPNPKLAPYGAAAVEILQHYQLLNKLENKLVYGESIAQTNQFIVTRSAEVGFTAMSVVLSPAMQGKGQWITIDDDSYSPIAQGVVVIKRNYNSQAHAMKFYEFLSSQVAKRILKRYGYY